MYRIHQTYEDRGYIKPLPTEWIWLGTPEEYASERAGEGWVLLSLLGDAKLAVLHFKCKGVTFAIVLHNIWPEGATEPVPDMAV